MPTYEYICAAGHAFEAFQKISERPKSKCPTCGKPAQRKISGGAGLVFRGSGVYITDYGKDGKGPRKPEAEKPAKASEGSGASGGAETASKPESSSSKQATGKGDKKAPKE